MTSSPFSLRHVAHGYCQFVLGHFGGIDGYQLVLYALILVFLGGVAFLTNERARPNVGRLVPPWLYCLLLTGALFAARLPTFLVDQMNPDEGMLLAGAMKLRHYPVFWRSLDGTSSGPLNYYFLTLLNVVGLPLDYATARLANVICIGGAIAIVYCIARLYMEDWAARLTALPALSAAMAFRHPDFLHYSSECVSVLLIAFGSWLLLAELAGEPNRLREIGIGAVAALLPLAKLQAVPMAALLLCAAPACAVWRRLANKWRCGLLVAAGAGGVSVLVLLFLLIFQLFDTFSLSYIANNIFYADQPQTESFEDLLRYYFLTPDVMWYEAGILIFSIGAAVLLPLGGVPAGRIWEGMRKRFTFADVFAVALLAVSVYAVFRPHRLFFHYFLFLMFPVALLGVLAARRIVYASDAGSSSVKQLLLFVLITVLLPGFGRGREMMFPTTSEARMAAGPVEPACAPCQAASEFANPGALIAVWGWEPRLYALTRMLPATRDTFTQWQIDPGPLRGYYRRRFMDDLHENPPEVFLDAVGRWSFRYKNRDKYGYETFSELHSYINSNFHYVGDVEGIRIFARNQAGARNSSSLPPK